MLRHHDPGSYVNTDRSESRDMLGLARRQLNSTSLFSVPKLT